MSLEALDRAASYATCQMLGAVGSNLVGVGVWTGLTGAGAGVSLGSLSLAAISYLAQDALCGDTEVGPAEWPDVQCVNCWKAERPSNAYAYLYGTTPPFSPTITNVDELVKISWANTGLGEGWTVEYLRDGNNLFYFLSADPSHRWCVDLREGGGCIDDEPRWPDPPLPPNVPDVTYNDQQTDCTYNIHFEGFVQQTENSPAGTVWTISGATQPERADGGRVGACFFEPTVYYQIPGGPSGPVLPPVPPGPPGPTPIPGPGPGGVPWWVGPVLGGATGAALKLIGDALAELSGPKLPEGSFTLTAPCDNDDQGNPLTKTWSYPEQKVQERMIAHQITQLEALQTHLNWKTPICGNEKPPLEGQWVTTRWESIEKMAHSGRRLRKLFRYRTNSTRDVGQLSAYWEAFTWQAGNVCVFHKGAWWGTPQVWASTEEEGQRVIRFAAAEAGLDPDQIGEWGTSSSRTPRYGMSGTMKVAQFEGFPWVASRDGAAWPNVLAKSSDP